MRSTRRRISITTIFLVLKAPSLTPTCGPGLPSDILNPDHQGMHFTPRPSLYRRPTVRLGARNDSLLFTRTAPTYSTFKTRTPTNSTPNRLTFSSISTRCPAHQSFRDPVPQKRSSRLSVGSSRYTRVRHPFIQVSYRRTKVWTLRICPGVQRNSIRLAR
jgi:hypothetical protein